MRIEVTGRHNGVSERMKDYAREKVARIARFFDRISRVQILLEAVHDERRAELVAHADTGAVLVADERNGDMFAAIDLAVDKLERQVTRHKQRLQERNRQIGEPFPPRAAAVEPEETFDQIIRREVRGSGPKASA